MVSVFGLMLEPPNVAPSASVSVPTLSTPYWRPAVCSPPMTLPVANSITSPVSRLWFATVRVSLPASMPVMA